jgi:hypothetical protein
VLHREPGPAVHDAALDLRPAELGIVLPLVGCLLALSAWPAAISGNSIGTNVGATLTEVGPSAQARPNDQPPEVRTAFVTVDVSR